MPACCLKDDVDKQRDYRTPAGWNMARWLDLTCIFGLAGFHTTYCAGNITFSSLKIGALAQQEFKILTWTSAACPYRLSFHHTRKTQPNCQRAMHTVDAFLQLFMLHRGS